MSGVRVGICIYACIHACVYVPIGEYRGGILRRTCLP